MTSKTFTIVFLAETRCALREKNSWHTHARTHARESGKMALPRRDGLSLTMALPPGFVFLPTWGRLILCDSVYRTFRAALAHAQLSDLRGETCIPRTRSERRSLGDWVGRSCNGRLRQLLDPTWRRPRVQQSRAASLSAVGGNTHASFRDVRTLSLVPVFADGVRIPGEVNLSPPALVLGVLRML